MSFEWESFGKKGNAKEIIYLEININSKIYRREIHGKSDFYNL